MRASTPTLLALLVVGTACASARPSAPQAVPQVAKTVEVSVTGTDEACYGHIYSEDQGCVHVWGIERPPLAPKAEWKVEEWKIGDGTEPVSGEHLDIDGRSRVPCGEVGELCGLRIYCQCGFAQPRKPR